MDDEQQDQQIILRDPEDDHSEMEFTDVPLNHESMSLEDLKSHCDILARNDTINKESAMNIMKIKYGMELLVLKTIHDKNIEISELKNKMSLDRIKIQHKQTLETTEEKHREELLKNESEINNLRTILSQTQITSKKR